MTGRRVAKAGEAVMNCGRVKGWRLRVMTWMSGEMDILRGFCWGGMMYVCV